MTGLLVARLVQKLGKRSSNRVGSLKTPKAKSALARHIVGRQKVLGYLGNQLELLATVTAPS